MKFFNAETDGNIDLGEKRKISTGTLNGMGVNNNLLKAKSAFQGFLLQSEVDFIIEKSWIAKTCEYIYKVVDGIQPNSYISRLITFFLVIAIILGFLVSFMETEQIFQYSPPSCLAPACDNDATLCPNEMICAPVPDPIFDRIDDAVIYLFAIEYVVKLLTCWAVSSRDLDIVDVDWDGGKSDEPPVYSLRGHYFRYFMQLKNIADLLTFLPVFVVMAIHGHNKAATNFLRVFRMFRVIRIYKGINRFDQARKMLILVVRTMLKSMDAMFVMLLLVFMAMIFYGSIIYAIEGGKFQVTADFPQGQYLRKSLNGYDIEVSPFKSIPTAMYYVIITCATVGFGDLAPTSWMGRTVACMMSLTAVVLLALPIGIIGSNFTLLYKDYLFEKEHGHKNNFAEMTEKEMLELFDDIDEDDNKTIDIFELKTAFDLMGLQVDGAKLTKFFADADQDHSGAISADEFIALCKRIQHRRAVKHKGELTEHRKAFDFSLLDAWKYSKAYFLGTEVANVKRGSSATNLRFLNPDAVSRDGNAKIGKEVHLSTEEEEESDGVTDEMPIPGDQDIQRQRVSTLTRETSKPGASKAAAGVAAAGVAAAGDDFWRASGYHELQSKGALDAPSGSMISVDNFFRVLSFHSLEETKRDEEDFGISPGAVSVDEHVLSRSRKKELGSFDESDSLQAKGAPFPSHKRKSAAFLLQRVTQYCKQKEDAMRLCHDLDEELAHIYGQLDKLHSSKS